MDEYSNAATSQSMGGRGAFGVFVHLGDRAEKRDNRMRCNECGIKLTSIEQLEKNLCSEACEAQRYRRVKLPKDRLHVEAKKNIKMLKKLRIKAEIKIFNQEQKRKAMLRRLDKFKDSDPFFQRHDWRMLRYDALKRYGRLCALCGETEGRMHVDHIKPRSLHPELALVFDNLQVLCEACNLGKSNRDDTDFRTPLKD